MNVLCRSLFRVMSSSASEIIPLVDIDSKGVFKYILISVTAQKNGNEYTAEVIRGYADCEFHNDINDKFMMHLGKMKESGDLIDFNVKVLGGGKINHDPDNKKIKVYGKSQGYGQANHKVSAEILKKFFEGYQIDHEGDDGTTSK